MRTGQNVGPLSLVVLLFLPALVGCGAATPTEEPAIGEHISRGNELTVAGDFAEAATEYERALSIDPENIDALTNLGVAYYQLGQLDRAIEQYSKAIEIAPDDAGIRSNLAAAYVQKHQVSGQSADLDSALEQYQHAVELDANLAEAFFGLGIVYMLLGQNDDAIQSFTQFQELDTGQDPRATQNAQQYLKQLGGQ
jgi:tetratricopeptide (TPR) repeat protein